MLGIFQIPSALPPGLTLAVKDAAGNLVPAADLFTDEPRTVPFAANPTTLAAGGQFWFYAATDGYYQAILGGTASAADQSWNGGAAKTFPLAPVVRPLAAASQAQAEDPAGITLLSWTAQRIWQAIAKWWAGVVGTLQPKLATIVDKGVSFDTSTLDDVTDNAKDYRATAAITITLETYTDKPEGFQFAVMAVGGAVTFAGTFVGQGGKTICAQGSCAWVIRDSAGWKVYGVTL